MELRFVERLIKVRFKNKRTLQSALTHFSCFGTKKLANGSNYERLEFLGDSLLSAYVSKIIFNKYRDSSEEELTNLRSALTSNRNLSKVAKAIGIADFVNINRNAFRYKLLQKNLDQIYAESLEALIGAIFIDRGEKKAQKFIETYVLSRLGEAVGEANCDDPKSALQKLLHQKYNENPVYIKLKEEGRHENYRCFVGVFISGRMLGKGEGHDKQNASENAAMDALARHLKK